MMIVESNGQHANMDLLTITLNYYSLAPRFPPIPDPIESQPQCAPLSLFQK